MTQPMLSVLIPTVVGREEQLDKLLGSISKQCGLSFTEVKMYGYTGFDQWHYKSCNNLPVWVEICKDNKEMTIGRKRELMYEHSNGVYSWMIDDDDDISDNAIELILEAIKQNPDCVTFEEHIDIDGKIQRSNHSLKYEDWANNQDGYDYVRTPFFKSVIKTEIARIVPIPHIRFGEDHQWAQALKPHLKTEVHIPEQIYRYIHVSTPYNERYGIK